MNIVSQLSPVTLSPELIARFTAIVGDKHALTDPLELEAYITEERNLYRGHSPLVLRPGSTEEVVAICKLANEARVALVPQGGNTGLVGGQTPHNGEVVISLKRMDKIREIDTSSNTITVEAGAILQRVQEKAAEVDRLFPLSLGAQEAAPSAATSRPMPAAPRRSPMAWRVTWRSASRSCSPTAG